MNIVVQEISATRIYIKASNGREVELFPARIKQEFDSRTGSRTQKRTATIDWIKQEIVNTLGPEIINARMLAIDFDDATGRVTDSTISRAVEEEGVR